MAEEVAEKLMIMHEECLEGNYQSIEKMRPANPPPISHVRQVNDDDDDNNDDGMGDDNTTNMMLDVPNAQPISNPLISQLMNQNPSKGLKPQMMVGL